MESDIISFVFSAFFAVKSKACAEVRSSMADYRDLASPTLSVAARMAGLHAPKIQRLGEDLFRTANRFGLNCGGSSESGCRHGVNRTFAVCKRASSDRLRGCGLFSSVVLPRLLPRPSTHGQGHPGNRKRSTGARNVGRVLGKPGFMLTVLADFCKGALAVWVAREWTNDQRLVVLAMLAVVAGQIGRRNCVFARQGPGHLVRGVAPV